MAAGESTAKETLYDEVEVLANKLDGSAEINVKDVGKGMAFLIRMFKPLYMATLVTESDLEMKLLTHENNCPALRECMNRRQRRFSIGPFSFYGALSNVSIAFFIFLFLVGKGKAWW